MPSSRTSRYSVGAGGSSTAMRIHTCRARAWRAMLRGSPEDAEHRDGEAPSGGATPEATCTCRSAASSVVSMNSCAYHSSAAHRPWWSRMLGRRSVMMRPRLSTAVSMVRPMLCSFAAQASSAGTRRLQPAGVELEGHQQGAQFIVDLAGDARALGLAHALQVLGQVAQRVRASFSSPVRAATQASSTSLARRSRVSPRLRSPMSTKLTTAPTTRPCSKMGWLAYSASKGACRQPARAPRRQCGRACPAERP